MGESARFLGCNIVRNYEKDSISLSQFLYIEETLVAAGMINCSGHRIPMDLGYRKERDTELLDNPLEYQRLVGKVNWLVIKTRPDIKNTVFLLQRRMNIPTEADQRAVTSMLRYLKATDRLGIELAADYICGLEIYVDAAHQDYEDRKSTEGAIIMYAGASISWILRKQTFVALSSTIAEFLAYDTAVKEVLYIRKVLKALNLPINPGTANSNKLIISTDSQNSMKILQHGNYTPAIRWLDNRYLFIRDLLQAGEVYLRFVPSGENVADALTKPLNREAFICAREGMKLKVINALKVEDTA